MLKTVSAQFLYVITATFPSEMSPTLWFVSLDMLFSKTYSPIFYLMLSKDHLFGGSGPRCPVFMHHPKINLLYCQIYSTAVLSRGCPLIIPFSPVIII